MNLDNLKMFCLVVEEGSISQAARVSYVSQPAVTKQIRQLENHVKASLFDRAGGKLSLTEAGLALYPYAKEIIEYIKRAEEAVEQVIVNHESTLYIGASLTIGEYLLPGILGNFQKKNKNIRFSLAIGNTPNIISKLEDNELDIALVEGIVMEKNLHVEKFGEDELVLVVSSNHRWNNRSEINIEELAEEKMIWREENAGVRRIIESILREHHVLEKIKSSMELGSSQAIKSAVEAELGIGILPKLSVLRELDMGVLKQITIAGIQMKRDLWVVKKPSRFPKQNLEQFIQFLMKYRDLSVSD